MNRKLIRPTLAEIRERSERDSRRGSGSDANRKRVPPEQTHAESFYYKKQMDNRTPDGIGASGRRRTSRDDRMVR